ncbi:hypothetical protein SAMN04488697_10855 [Pseudomonas sp. 43mfcvi1.1]|nr:hypothetical protein ATJ40_10855 [Pseudomonas sp. 43mfcvi1.1]SSB97426.1 hypothetical protein SAMN04488697_10855 [Pseudomonas sp. 43mfcvi1.1]
MSVLKTPDTAAIGKLNSTPSTGLCLPIDFPMHSNLKTCAPVAPTTSPPSMSSPQASPARTSALPDAERATKTPEAYAASAAACSGKSYVSSRRYNLAGWCLRTSLTCSLSTIAKTLRQSSGPLRTAGMWDFGECLMLNISESPSNVVEYSWSPVIDECPPSSSWLTPRQWMQYLQRLARSNGHAPRIPGLPILYWQTKPAPRSLWAVPLSSLIRTDGIRWLSGSERLKMMGFASDWMRPTLRRLSVPEMPLLRRLRSGLAQS